MTKITTRLASMAGSIAFTAVLLLAGTGSI
jgi:hypothetical protein